MNFEEIKKRHDHAKEQLLRFSGNSWAVFAHQDRAFLLSLLDDIAPLPDKWRNQKSKQDDAGQLVECTRIQCAKELQAKLTKEQS